MSAQLHPAATPCPNCEAPVAGEFCAACGQKRVRADDLSVRRFFDQLADEIMAFRLNSKTVRSLGGLFAPRQLTEQYLAGRRARFLSPIKIYFLCAAIFFFAAPWAGFNLASMLARNPEGEIAKLVDTRRNELGLPPSVFAERFDVRVPTVFTLTLTLGVLAFALALQLLYRGKRLPFGAHLVFAVHYVAVLYLITLATGALLQVTPLPQSTAAGLGVILMAVYLAFALARVYRDPARVTLAKSLLLLIVTLTFTYLVNYWAIVFTLRLI
ncbi:MAG: DUF3667 domain-containing protein [Candidatus Eiseniibacteriota bacterium]